MENIIRQTTEFAMHIVRAYVKPGDTVVDATCGNGHDTLALAEMGPEKLYAFDVQEAAVRATTELLEANGYGKSITESRIIVRQLAHEDMADCIDEPVKVVVFNLGYLPGGDKACTTRTETTLAAVQDAMELLRPDGLICITMYSGHAEGKQEKKALLELAEGLDAGKWHTAYISMPNQKHDPPEILLITRKS
ncbi:MAG: 50S ribosomal protein L11 methyltransferase [Clostridia bacterium]|nr:50S ribosomal protein L11 methyltransferase [Clostridia bacterium]